MIKSEPVDRFYLSKGEKTVYIDNANIPLNYLEGIRFLYRSFNKKKPGIILSDESDTSRNSQIVLFLKAVQNLISKTILIVCPEDAEQIWMRLFQQWTEFNEDVVIETEKPYIKKKVIINPSQGLQNFCSREWGMIIVDDDQTMLDILRYPLKADFKIWSSPTKMTENLHVFSQIYKWLYPKSKFNEGDFVMNKRNPHDAVNKAILLDAFLEDVVLRTRNTTDMEQPIAPERPKVTRKNKDATGTKIKRSKPKPCEDIPGINISKAFEEITGSNSNVESTINSIAEENNRQNVANKAINNDIDNDECTFMNYKKKRDVIEDSEVNRPENSQETQSELNLYYESTENSDKIYEMDTLPLDNEDFNESRNNEVNGIKINIYDSKVVDENINIEKKVSNEIEENSKTKLNVTHFGNELTNDIFNDQVLDPKDNGNGHSPSDNDLEPNADVELSDVNKLGENCGVLNRGTKDKTKEIIEKKNISNDILSHEQASKDLEFNAGENISKVNKLINEIDEKGNELTNEILSNQVLYNKDNGINIELNADASKSDANKLSEKSELTTNTLKRGIADKMKEIEEKALKKFKGSILDSLF